MFWWLETKRMFSEYTLLIAIPWMGNLHIMIICLNNGNILDRDIFILGQILITTRSRIKMHWYFDSIVLWGLLGQKHLHIFIITSCWHILLHCKTLAFFVCLLYAIVCLIFEGCSNATVNGICSCKDIISHHLHRRLEEQRWGDGLTSSWRYPWLVFEG